MNSPVEALPDELLLEIIWLRYHENGHKQLMGVCRRWRRLIVSEGSLWSVIDISNERNALLHLKRSQSTLLTILADHHTISFLALEAVCSVPGRIKSLRMTDCNDAHSVSRMIGILQANAMEQLVELVLSPRIYGSRSISTFDLPFTSPRLEHLHIECVRLKIPPHCFANLRSLTLFLESGDDKFSMDALMDGFNDHNLLETLKLTVDGKLVNAGGSLVLPHPAPTTRTGSVQFPALVSLDLIIRDRASELRSFFSRISNPQPIKVIKIRPRFNCSLTQIIPATHLIMFSPSRDTSVTIHLRTFPIVHVKYVDVDTGEHRWCKQLYWDSCTVPVPDQEQIIRIRDIGRITGSPHVKHLLIGTTWSTVPMDDYVELLSAYPNVTLLHVVDSPTVIQALGRVTYLADHHSLCCRTLQRLEVKISSELLLASVITTLEARSQIAPVQKLTIYHPVELDITMEHKNRISRIKGLTDLCVEPL